MYLLCPQGGQVSALRDIEPDTGSTFPFTIAKFYTPFIFTLCTLCGKAPDKLRGFVVRCSGRK